MRVLQAYEVEEKARHDLAEKLVSELGVDLSIPRKWRSKCEVQTYRVGITIDVGNQQAWITSPRQNHQAQHNVRDRNDRRTKI